MCDCEDCSWYERVNILMGYCKRYDIYVPAGIEEDVIDASGDVEVSVSG